MAMKMLPTSSGVVEAISWVVALLIAGNADPRCFTILSARYKGYGSIIAAAPD